MVIMIQLTVGSAIAADPAKFSVTCLILLGMASTCYVLWNLAGTVGIVALVFRENAAPPPVETRVPRCGALTYFSVQIALAGLVYKMSDHGHIPNLVWLVLLPPVAYAVFLMEWRGIMVVSLLMIAFLAVNVYRGQGLTCAIFAAAAFSFAVLFTLVFSLLAMHSEKARGEVQRLASELAAANQRLREYAVQAEELAASKQSMNLLPN
jgi:hypothetical protein